MHQVIKPSFIAKFGFFTTEGSSTNEDDNKGMEDKSL